MKKEKKSQKKYYDKNKEKYHKLYLLKNDFRTHREEHINKSIEEIQAYKHQWYEANKERIREKTKEYAIAYNKYKKSVKKLMATVRLISYRKMDLNNGFEDVIDFDKD